MIDPNKTYQTRDGREVRVYAVDGGGVHPVHGAIAGEGGKWVSVCWREDGRYSGLDGDPADLIEVKPKRIYERWVNVYESGGAAVYSARKAADAFSTSVSGQKRIACLHIHHEYEEGEGL